MSAESKESQYKGITKNPNSWWRRHDATIVFAIGSRCISFGIAGKTRSCRAQELGILGKLTSEDFTNRWAIKSRLTRHDDWLRWTRVVYNLLCSQDKCRTPLSKVLVQRIALGKKLSSFILSWWRGRIKTRVACSHQIKQSSFCTVFVFCILKYCVILYLYYLTSYHLLPRYYEDNNNTKVPSYINKYLRNSY